MVIDKEPDAVTRALAPADLLASEQVAAPAFREASGGLNGPAPVIFQTK